MSEIIFEKDIPIYSRYLKSFKEANNVVLNIVLRNKFLCAYVESKFIDADKFSLYETNIKCDNFKIEKDGTKKIKREDLEILLKKLKDKLLKTEPNFSCDPHPLDDFDLFEEKDKIEINKDLICAVCYKYTSTKLECCKGAVCMVCLNNISVSKQKQGEKKDTICPLCRTDHEDLDEDCALWQIDN